MKRSLFLLTFGLLALGLQSCDVLEADPIDSVPGDRVFQNEDNFRGALIGAYNSLQNFMDDYIIMEELASDNARHSGSYPSWLEVDTHNLLTNNPEASGQWVGSYDLINVANSIIEFGPTVPTTATFKEADRDNVIAQAKVLRAFAYHNLVKWFSGVPLVLQATTPSSVQDTAFVYQGRASSDAVYAQIVKDLQEAEATLGAANANYATVDGWTAKALLARVYLFQGQWQKAADKALEVMNGPFTLAPSPSALYEGKGSSESIWELAYSNQDANALAFFAYPSGAGGRWEYAPTAEFMASVPDNDLRKEYLFAKIKVGNTTYDVINKYYRTETDDDPVWLVRLPEMLLTRAEALAHLNDEAGALALVNQVRARAGLGAVTAAGQQAVLDAVLAERRVELAYEGHRYHDLVRTGRAPAVLEITDARKVLWPIPQRDMDLNTKLKQNDGY